MTWTGASVRCVIWERNGMWTRIRNYFAQVREGWRRLQADDQPPAGSGMDIYAGHLLRRIQNGEEVIR